MRVVLAQIDPTVGDLDGNAERVAGLIAQAERLGADLVAFPELVLSGYPPEDLLLRSQFLRDCRRALDRVAAACGDLVAIVGVPLAAEGSRAWTTTGTTIVSVANAAAVVARGRVKGLYRKIRLPNYAVFDEERYFEPGDRLLVARVGEALVAVNVCEDIWSPCGPTEEAVRRGGAQVVVNISMSPYHQGKGSEREDMLRARAVDAGAFIAYVNGVGGQDELVFDGQSLVVAPEGTIVARGPQFEEALVVADLDPARAARPGGLDRASSQWGLEVVTVGEKRSEMDVQESTVRAEQISNAAAAASGPGGGVRIPEIMAPGELMTPLAPVAEVYAALGLGVKDYVEKNRFREVVIGLSGGIDSALTACIAVDALGPERVTGVTMPSRYSTEGTRSDAIDVAENLGITLLEMPIETTFAAYLETLGPVFSGREPDSTEENLQARIRGNLLMALSNKFGWLVLTTGNKSEMAVGYATLYGDMAGGFAVIKDVPKTLVYDLAAYRNSLGPGVGPIPETTMTRAPSAELRPDQTDQDTLPPYDVLDRIIDAYVVRDEGMDEIVSQGLDADTVRRVLTMIDFNEYKRRQAAPGVRITPKAFGKDRRLPITNRYRG